MNEITHRLHPGRGFYEISFRVEERRGHPVVLIAQGKSWLAVPVDSWVALADAIDDELDVTPQLGKLFKSGTSVTTPAKWGKHESKTL